MSKFPNRRDLTFSTFDDVINEVNQLQTQGYSQNGNWNLAETCKHLVEWMRFPMDGYPRPPLPIRAMFWVIKVTMVKRIQAKILAEGFSPGMRTAPDTVFDVDESHDKQSVAELISTIERLRTFDGEFAASPLFGKADKETLFKTQILHCAHHLGYLSPKGSS